MNFSRFFLDRPIFAAVLSIVIFAVGLIAIPNLPVSEYPDVVPPSVMVQTVYPGANPKEIADTVATPLEESISGVEDLMYYKSVAGSDGVLQMTVTFRPGTDPDDATVRVQNRVSQTLARLPEAVRRQGVTTQKQSPTFLMVVHLTSPNDRYDTLYLRNYARLHVRDRLARVPGVGDAQIFGGGDYAMRAWLDPQKVAARGLTASDVVRQICNTEQVNPIGYCVGGTLLATTLDYARGVGVKIAIEPLHPMYAADRACVNTMRHALDICDRLGAGIGCAVDVYHVWWDPELPEQIARAGRERIMAFHICDWLVPTRDLLTDRGMMGDGVIDIPGLRAAVEAEGFDGLNEVEIFSADNWWRRDPDEVLRTMIERGASAC